MKEILTSPPTLPHKLNFLMTRFNYEDIQLLIACIWVLCRLQNNFCLLQLEMTSTEGFFYKIIKFCVFHDVQGQQNFKVNISPYANVDVYTQPCRGKIYMHTYWTFRLEITIFQVVSTMRLASTNSKFHRFSIHKRNTSFNSESRETRWRFFCPTPLIPQFWAVSSPPS